jgi:hypothetical protein
VKTALLVLISVAYGALAALLFRQFPPSRRTINRILAHVLEFRLFADEPGIVFRAQRDLLRENLILLRQVAVPCVVLAAVWVFAYNPMVRYFAPGPVPGGPSIVIDAPDSWRPPRGIVAETPPVHVARLHLVSWRVHAASDYAGGPQLLGLPWLAWFLSVSTLTAAAMRKR